MERYENLDLSLFRVNEAGEPLALPWIEQEAHMSAFFDYWIETKEATGFLLLESEHECLGRFRSLYTQPFSPSEHLTGDKALFEGWENVTKQFERNGQTIELEKFKIGRKSEYSNPTGSESSRFYWSHPSKSGGYSFKPQTVAHFIDDCARAKIPLVWSPYAVGLLTGKEATNG